VSAPVPTGLPLFSKRIVGTVAGRPDLWLTACGVLFRLAVPRWWTRRPYLPLPDPRLWAFRMVTAYGRPDADPVPADVISYLEWCRSTSARARRLRSSPAGHGGPGTLTGPQSG